MKELKVYINGLFFDHLANEGHYGDRIEFYREHERSLWTIYQILKSGFNTLVVTDMTQQVKFTTSDAQEFKKWVKVKYPDFAKQLKNLEYTKYPHPADRLEG